MTTANLAVADNEAVVQYESAGETVFAYPFPILASDELKVSVDQVLKTLGVDYTLSGIGQANGGNVTFGSATSAGEIVTIWLEMPIKRLTGFQLGAATLLPQALNTEFARQVRVDQMLRRDIGRCLRLAVDDPEPGQSVILPTASARANRYLRFDSNGAPEVAEELVAGSTLSRTTIGEYLYPITPTEDDLGVVVVDIGFREGTINRYGTNAVPGVTDMTTAFHTACNVARARNGSVRGLDEVYRVTSGYVNDLAGGDLQLIGEGVSYGAAVSAATAKGTCLLLDSTDPNSFFFSQEASNQVTARDITFACAQYVADRKFFRTSASSVKHIFDNLQFVAVERPVVWETGTYFQMSAYRNIRFTNSGSFHSEVSSGLIGTLMIAENIDVEGTVPANTEKVIMNLSCVRQIRGEQVLIEPSTPSSGWTGLMLFDDYDPDWARFTTCYIDGFWMEVTGSGLTYALDQRRGRSVFVGALFNNGADAPIRLRQNASIHIDTSTYSGTTDPLQDYFDLEDYTCQVKLSNVNYTNPGTVLTDPRFTLENCSFSPSDGQEPSTATAHDNKRAQLLASFDGGYLDPGRATIGLFSGTTYTPTTDATYGRALSVIPSANTINIAFQAKAFADFPAGGQFYVVLKAKAPTLSSGTLSVVLLVDSVAVAAGGEYTSGQDILLVVPVTVPTADPTVFGVGISTATATGNLTIYQMEIWSGKSLPNVPLPSFPLNVVTFAAAAPTAGTWVRGDIVWNNAPSAAGVPGWVCTAGGTPGTWNAMAALAA